MRRLRVKIDAPLLWVGRSRIPGWVWVVLLWFLLVVPAIFLRGAHYEEGITIALARGAFEDGQWLSPSFYGVRQVERPTLVSWILGTVGLLTGRIDLWVGRLPGVLALLGGGLLIHGFVRRYADKRSAVFGAICFLISPMMLQKLITAEVDGFVSVLLFAAFVTWWTGHEAGRISPARWLSLAALLTAAVFVKGPQPLAFIFLGVGTYLIVRRQGREFCRLVLLGMVPAAAITVWYGAVYQPGDFGHWLVHSRISAPSSTAGFFTHSVRFFLLILLELLPGILLAVPLGLAIWRGQPNRHRDLAQALLLYAGMATAALIFWPDANGRYAMPAVLAVAAAAGLFFEHVRARSLWLTSLAQLVAGLLIFYALFINLILMPIAPQLFRGAAKIGEPIAAAVGVSAPVYVVDDAVHRNALLSVRAPVRRVAWQTLKTLEPPFFLLVTAEQGHRSEADLTCFRLVKILDLPSACLFFVEKP